MDNMTMIEGESALCSYFFCTISGKRLSAETRGMAARHWRSLTDAPWDPSLDQTEAYGEGFFQGVGKLTSMRALRARWASSFDTHGAPLPTTDRLGFLQDFLSTLLHAPHHYHNFFYTTPTVSSGHAMDWPIKHPVAIEFWTIYLCWGGHGTLHYRDQCVQLPPGTICILSPGCEATLHRADDTPFWSFGWLNFRPQVGWFELLDWAFSVNQPTVVFNEVPTLEKVYRPPLEELTSISYQPSDIHEKLCLNLIESVLIRLRRDYERRSHTEPSNNLYHLPDSRVEKAATYVLNHYHEAFKLDDVAAFATLSASRLNELFREHYQTSVMQWRDVIRLNKARELLVHTELTVATISRSVGWEDPLYFSRRFKQAYGMSPRSFRVTPMLQN